MHGASREDDEADSCDDQGEDEPSGHVEIGRDHSKDDSNGNIAILTDIQGLEDFLGDMDFKVTGTPDGVTALQMDIKVHGLNREILKQALDQAKVGRAEILANMLEEIAEPRAELSKWAPRAMSMQINPDKIRIVIGKGGEMINKIIEECDQVKIDIDDDGKVVIYHTSKEDIQKAKDMIDEITRVAEVGQVYDATVVRLEKFGAFVELFKGTDALLHVSKIRHERVDKPEDVLKLGDIVKVTPSSKVVGDLAIFMVQNALTPENIVEKGNTMEGINEKD